MKLIKWLWQLPQNLVGFCLTRKPVATEDYKDVRVYFTHNVLGCGVSLGDFIVLDAGFQDHCQKLDYIKHEYGHHKQSMYFGWLYLIVIGLWSAIRNRYDCWFHKKWTEADRLKWYYGSYPENWADTLGGVNRT